MAKKQNKLQKKKPQQSGNPVLAGVPEIMTPDEFRLFMQRFEQKHANFMANLKTDETRKAAEKRHKENVKVLTEHIYVMKPSEAAKLGSKPTPPPPKYKKVKKAPPLGPGEYPTVGHLKREIRTLMIMARSYNTDLASKMAVQLQLKKVKIYKAFVERYKMLEDDLEVLVAYDLERKFSYVNRNMRMIGYESNRDWTRLNALEKLQEAQNEFETSMRGLRLLEEQFENATERGVIVEESDEEPEEYYESSVKIEELDDDEVVEEAEKTLGSVDASSVLAVLESVEALKVRVAKYIAKRDSDDFEVPPCDEMYRELDVYLKMYEGGRTDPEFQQFLKKKSADTVTYEKHVEKLTELEGRLDGMDYTNIGPEVQLLFELRDDLKAGRRVEETMELLEKKIRQLNACFDLLEAHNDFKCFVKGMEEQKEQEKKMGTVDASKMNQTNEKPKQTAEKNEKKGKDQKTTTTPQAKLQDFVSALRQYEQAPDVSNLEIPDMTSLYDPYPDFEFPTQEELQREIDIANNMKNEGRTDPLFQKAYEVKVAKLETYVKLNKKYQELNPYLKDDPNARNMAREAKNLKEILQDIQEGRRDERSLPMLLESTNKLMEVFEIIVALNELKGELKGKCEQEEQYKHIYAEFANGKGKEQETPVPTPEDAFQFPTDEDLSREIQILSNMQKRGRTDPSFQKALNVKQTKIEIYKAFLKKVDELQLRDRLEDLTVENMERDAKDLQDTLTDFQKGDVKTMPVLREKIDSLVASLEINEIVTKLKSDLKGIREQEEQCIKEGTMVAPAEPQPVVPALPKQQQATKAPEVEVEIPATEDLDDFEFPTADEVRRARDEYTSMLEENSPDPLFQQVLKLKGEKFELYKTFYTKIWEFRRLLGCESDKEKLKRETSAMSKLIDDVAAGRSDRKVSKETMEKFRAFEELGAMAVKYTSDMKRLEEELKKKSEQLASVSKSSAPCEVQAAVPAVPKEQPVPETSSTEDLDDYPLPSQDEIVRECEEYVSMAKENRPDPLFQKALKLKREKCEAYKTFYSKLSEMLKRIEGVDLDELQLEVAALRDLVAEVEAGRADEEQVVMSEEKMDQVRAAIEMVELTNEFKRSLKRLCEQEESLKKESEQVTSVSKSPATCEVQGSVPAVPKASDPEDLDDYPSPTPDEIDRECQEYASMLEENCPDPLFQQVLKLKGQKHEVYKTFRAKALELKKRFGGLNIDELKRECLEMWELVAEVEAGRADARSLKISEEQIDRVTAFAELMEVIREFRRDWKRLCELEEDLKKKSEQVASVSKSSASCEVQGSVPAVPEKQPVPEGSDPEDLDDYPLPTSDEVAREYQEYTSMLEENNPDPLFQQAIKLKGQKCDMLETLRAKVVELEKRFGGLEMEELRQECLEMYRLVADVEAGIADERSLKISEEHIDRVTALMEMAELKRKFKSDWKSLCELEEDLKKKREQLASVSKSSAPCKVQGSVPAVPKEQPVSEASAPEDIEDFPIPTHDEIVRDCEELTRMVKENRHDPLSYKARKLKREKCELFETFQPKLSEILERLDGVDLEELEREATALRESTAEVEAGRADEQQLVVSEERMEQIRDAAEMGRLVNEFKRSLKRLCEQEEKLKKDQEKVAKVFKTMASKSRARNKPLPKQPKSAKSQMLDLSITSVDPDFAFPTTEEMAREYEILAEMADDVNVAHNDVRFQTTLQIQFSKVEIFQKLSKKFEEVGERMGSLNNLMEEGLALKAMQAKWNAGEGDAAELPEYLMKLRKFKACKEMVDFKSEMIIELKAVLEQEAHFKKFGTLPKDEPRVEVEEEPQEESEEESEEEESESDVENPDALTVRLQEYINGVPFGWEPYQEPDPKKIKADKKAWKKMRKEWREQRKRRPIQKKKPQKLVDDWTRTWVLSFIVLEFIVILCW